MNLSGYRLRHLVSGRLSLSRRWVIHKMLIHKSNCVLIGKPSLHGSVTVRHRLSGPGVLLDGGAEVEAAMLDDKTVRIRFCDVDFLKSYDAVIHAPAQLLRCSERKINTFDVSPSGELIVVGTEGGDLQIFDAKRGNALRKLEGHIGDVVTARFFPSGEVVLTGSNDFQLKIWSALDGSNPVTIKGRHKGRISDTAIVSRGRNVITSSNDGSIRLWECASSDLISTLYESEAAINQLSLCEYSKMFPNLDTNVDSREVDTAGKIVVAAADDGTLKIIDLRTKKSVSTSTISSPLYSCAAAPELHLAISGSIDGQVHLWDLSKDNSTPVYAFRRGTTAITAIHPFKKDSQFGLFISTMDGIVYFVEIPLNLDSQPTVKHEFSGADLEPIYALRVRKESEDRVTVYSGARDGMLRIYECSLFH
ncbi:WD40-repeat-containing domain protein [Paraphysoderma sedebokerense]|nr:WD40-repeat-containing domain protein [Paraphysoderma sedebokerense]